MYGDDSNSELAPNSREPQNRAFAGVGRPMKPIVCRSSRLNLASLNAENAAIMKAANGNTWRSGSRNAG